MNPGCFQLAAPSTGYVYRTDRGLVITARAHTPHLPMRI